MLVYILRRIVQIVPTVLGITFVVFLMMRSIPGDPVVALLGDAYTEEDAVKARETYGLNQPVLLQYLIWLGKIVQGDWGTSILTGRPVLQDVLIRLPVTLELVALSMGVLTYKGATAKEALGAELKAAVPGWIKKEKLPPQAKAGALVFASSGCLNCHTYLSVGGSQLGAPNLSAEGAKKKGVTFQIDHLKCPSCVNKGSPMPSFADFSEADLRKIATFLEASKGPQ